MLLLQNQTAYLTNAAGGELGEVRIERVEGDLVLGEFTPGADYDTIRSVFEEFEAAVEQQMLAEVDRLDQRIRELRLCIRVEGGADTPIRDAQIYSDGGISFRQNETTKRNGVHHA